MMWHDDSSPYRVQPLVMRMRLEMPPSGQPRKPQGPRVAPRMQMAVCHPERRHHCRGYCAACYQKLNLAGMFRLYPELRLRPA